MDLHYSIEHPILGTKSGTAEELVLFIFEKQLHKQNLRVTCKDLSGKNSFVGIEIEINIYDGDVTTIDTCKASGACVHNEYFFLTDPIVNAIKLTALLMLLEELDKYQDKKISKIINRLSWKKIPSIDEINTILKKIVSECQKGVSV